jgi:hypothetical protein
VVSCLLFLNHWRWDLLLSLWLIHLIIIRKSPISNWRFRIFWSSTRSRFICRLLWRNSSSHKVWCSWLLHSLWYLWSSCFRLLIFLEVKICCLSPVTLWSYIVSTWLPLICWLLTYQVNIWALIRHGSLRLFFI